MERNTFEFEKPNTAVGPESHIESISEKEKLINIIGRMKEELLLLEDEAKAYLKIFENRTLPNEAQRIRAMEIAKRMKEIVNGEENGLVSTINSFFENTTPDSPAFAEIQNMLAVYEPVSSRAVELLKELEESI